jgi:hypothetical protein
MPLRPVQGRGGEAVSSQEGGVRISRLRDDMTACEPDGLISEIYAFLKEQAK